MALALRVAGLEFQVDMERPARKLNFSAGYLGKMVVLPSVRSAMGAEQQGFRLDIEFSRLEVAAHSLMPRECWLVSL